VRKRWKQEEDGEPGNVTTAKRLKNDVDLDEDEIEILDASASFTYGTVLQPRS
jgi:hypothetical protein